jgi:hypothetical protein
MILSNSLLSNMYIIFSRWRGPHSGLREDSLINNYTIVWGDISIFSLTNSRRMITILEERNKEGCFRQRWYFGFHVHMNLLWKLQKKTYKKFKKSCVLLKILCSHTNIWGKGTFYIVCVKKINKCLVKTCWSIKIIFFT